MNLIVKQTEEFAYKNHDNDKLTSITRNNGSNSRKLPSPTNNSSITKLSDDKWEIGEWSNDLAKQNLINTSNIKTSKCYDNNQTIKQFNSGRNNNNSMFNEFNTSKRLNNNRYTNRVSPFCERQALNDSAMYNVQMYNRQNSFLQQNSSLVSNSLSTFSPVIGRPTPTLNSSMLSNVPPQTLSRVSNFNIPNNNNNHFSLNSSLDSNFPLMDIFNSTTATTSSNHQTNIIPENYNQQENLQSLFSNNVWNKNSLDGFGSSNAFLLSPVDSLPKCQIQTTTNSSFNFNFDNNLSVSDGDSWSSWNNFPHNGSINSTKQTCLSNSLNVSANNNNTFSTTNVNASLKKWPSSSTSASPPSSSPFASTIVSKQLGTSSSFYNNNNPTSANNNNNRVWSPFDPYLSNSTQPLICPTGFTTKTTTTSAPATINTTNEKLATITNSSSSKSSSLYEGAGSVFELFGGNSPWLPLDTPILPPNSSNNSNISSTISPLDTFTDSHFSPNPSQTSSNSSSATAKSSSSTSSSNLNLRSLNL